MSTYRLTTTRTQTSLLRLFATLFLLLAVGLLVVELIRYSRYRAVYPVGTTIGGVPVGGLDREQATQRLLETFNRPVELHYGDQVILLSPAVAGFELDLNGMLAAADQVRTQQGFWKGFWDFLWGRQPQPVEVPLLYTYSETRLRSYLEHEVAARYDQPPAPPQPIVGTVNFTPGHPGTTLDLDAALSLIEKALEQPENRRVILPLRRTTPIHPGLQTLKVLLKQAATLHDFHGVLGVYLLDLQTGQELHFVAKDGQDLPVPPEVAFTAASTIKIPIMVSVMRRVDYENLPEEHEVRRWLEQMITLSGNDPADWLMEKVIDKVRGPLEVTKDMRELGLENTFLAGYFYPGAPLLAQYTTPANQRTDVNTDPDPYNQTAVSDLGMLLEDIYQCAAGGGGTFAAVWPGQITPGECRIMLDLLSRNRIARLLEEGVPEGTRVAHKHGWVTGPDGYMHTIGDAGIIYSPGGSYVLVIFIQDQQPLIWEPSAAMFADLGRAVYNYFNTR